MKKKLFVAFFFDFVIVFETTKRTKYEEKKYFFVFSSNILHLMLHNGSLAIKFVHLFSLHNPIILCVLIFVLISSGGAILTSKTPA